MSRSDELHERVRAFIARPTHDPRELDAIALELAAFQLEHVEPVRRLAQARGVSAPTSSAEIVALPTDVFRLRRVAAHEPQLDVRVFRTSGTTSGARGSHALRTLATYEAAALRHAQDLLWPDQVPTRALVLAAPAALVPDSSLSFMIDLFIERLALQARHVFDRAGLQLVALNEELAACQQHDGPVLVMGTAFAYVHALDALGDRRFALPAGSRAMLTGGFKGRSREVPEAELRAALSRTFGIDPARILGEYGMTELSSQLYEPRVAEPSCPASVYRAPGWVRVDAVDPETLAPLPAGAVGLARILDLANVDSSIGILTHDRVRVVGQGDVELLGRMPGATPRGCSLAIEELERA